MQKVKFTERFEYLSPLKSVVFPKGVEAEVTKDIADAAHAAGKLEETNGRQPDKGSAEGSPAGVEGGAKR